MYKPAALESFQWGRIFCRAARVRGGEVFAPTSWLLTCCVFLAVMIGAASVARAATFVWDGGHPARDMWSFQQNWNPNEAPLNNGTADLLFTGSIRLTPEVD